MAGGAKLLLPLWEKVGMRGAKPQASRHAKASLTLTQLRIGSLAFAKAPYPSPIQGEGQKGSAR
jgi:hypothetical protein